MSIECMHGQLARSCERCADACVMEELRARIAELEAERDADRKREYGYSQETVNALTSERDALLARAEKAEAEIRRCTDAYHDEVHRLADMTLMAQGARNVAEAELKWAREDVARMDWLADPANAIGNVQLPTHCVAAHPHSLRDAIDAARKGEAT